MSKPYGKELILDLHDCEADCFYRAHIDFFFQALCKSVGMQAEDRHFWDDVDTPPDERETEPHLVGTSAVQFIKTSNITIHTLDILRRVYLNVFSCSDFDADVVVTCALEYFGGRVESKTEVVRQ